MTVDKTVTWVTPLRKQCFVTSGVALNMAQLGLVMGFSSTLVPQLKEAGSEIPIDVHHGSWIAAVPGCTILIGNLLVPNIMAKFGRRAANLASLFITAVAWACIMLATSVSILIFARALQGIGMGMIATLGPVLVGEYVSPKHRGAFLMTLSIMIAVGVFAIHSMGLYVYWKTVALICIAITVLDLTIVLCSPESPSWLADQGKFEECRKVFRWLRGDLEEEELQQLINSRMTVNKPIEIKETKNHTLMIKLKNKLQSMRDTAKLKEFYKPIIIMSHLYAMGQWSGVNIFASYAVDLIKNIGSHEANAPYLIISFDIQRIISNVLALIIIQKIKRRTMMKFTVGLNIVIMAVISVYLFLRTSDLLSYDNVYIGVVLLHVHMFSIAVGALPMCFILAGEIFPLRYKSVTGGISSVTFSVNIFISVKTVPYLFEYLGLYGTYTLYSIVLVYCLIVSSSLLPETKDKTLLDIEEEFRRTAAVAEIAEVEPKYSHNSDSV